MTQDLNKVSPERCGGFILLKRKYDSGTSVVVIICSNGITILEMGKSSNRQY